MPISGLLAIPDKPDDADWVLLAEADPLNGTGNRGGWAQGAVQH